MTYPEAIQFLYSLRLFGFKLGLENTFKLAALAGNPQEKLRFIHVAGTNGKGSTCAMLESIYRTAGLRVGLFTSPHLVSFRERIQVNRQLISETDVVRLVSEMKSLIETGLGKPETVADVGNVAASFSSRDRGDAVERNLKVAATGEEGKGTERNLNVAATDGGTGPERSPKAAAKRDDEGRKLKLAATSAATDVSHPTFFEVVTVMALRYFAEQQCDLVIWETGMGGRLDATNIVTPLASVITNIDFDHQQWLGNTLAEIAAEKAGIIKPRVPVLTATDMPEALEVIARTARERKAPLTKVGQASNLSWAGKMPALPLPGEHQRLNAALAIATVEVLRDEISVGDDTIRVGLETVQWPGRLQMVKTKSGQTILLDGAHNAAGAEALRDTLRSESFRAAISADLVEADRKPSQQDSNATLILGVLADKDWEPMCEALAPLAVRVLLAPVRSERAASPERLREACARVNPSAQVAACPSLADALKEAADAPFVIITGSLYLVGEAMELLGLSPPASEGERGLNEWSVKK